MFSYRGALTVGALFNAKLNLLSRKSVKNLDMNFLIWNFSNTNVMWRNGHDKKNSHHLSNFEVVVNLYLLKVRQWQVCILQDNGRQPQVDTNLWFGQFFPKLHENIKWNEPLHPLNPPITAVLTSKSIGAVTRIDRKFVWPTIYRRHFKSIYNTRTMCGTTKPISQLSRHTLL